MTLVPCRQCGASVDQSATVCPNCGTASPGSRVAAAPHAGASPVVITGIKIPFGDLVMLIMKVILASIPAYILLVIIFMMLAATFGGFFAGLAGAAGGM